MAYARGSGSSPRRRRQAQVNNVAGLAAYHAGVLQDLATVQEANSTLENKNSALVAGELVIMPILISRVHTWTLLSAFGVYFMTVSLAFTLAASWPRNNKRSTVDVRNQKHAFYLGLQDKDLLLKLISTALNSGSPTNDENKNKAMLYQVSVVLFILGAIMSTASFSMHTLPVSWGLPRI